ncbi:MAG: YifB family Mg chelatase-like AAA ATPase [Kiritimatiellae bacterium]|nr:YifB family Mg chelatase-like AAA ATPase [Kiritimatiellia bacterium]
MLAKCYSGALCGVDARTVEIEVYSTLGTSQFAIVGLPDQAVREAKDRIPTALKNSALSSGREFDVTVNLAPADVRKEGPVYDLAIAVCLLKATGRLRTESLADYAFAGELALSGEVRRVRGILPIAIEMRRIGRKAILVPYENAMEASVVKGIDVIAVRNLQEAVQFLNGEREITPHYTDLSELVSGGEDCIEDFADVKGQASAKKALEIAVAGGHNVLMIGSPGSGKTMLARRVPSILPPLTVDEALEVSRIHSVAGVAKSSCGFVTRRPFRAPHHTVSAIGLLGGGTRPLPGEVSLAHRGVLFLDEFAEFPRQALEVLRQPLEDGHVAVSRAAAACDYPSKFMLVAAMNPCPCGYRNDRMHQCRCSINSVLKYQGRVSGPLLDRIDIQLEVPSVDPRDLPFAEPGESSREIRKRVIAARALQEERYRDLPGVHTNGEVRSRDLLAACGMAPGMKDELVRTIERLRLSARAYDKVLRVARTLADLDGSEAVRREDLMGAISYRRLDGAGDSFWI